MADLIAKKSFLIPTFLSLILTQQAVASSVVYNSQKEKEPVCMWTDKHTVSINVDMPDPNSVSYHCKSADNDLGTHTGNWHWFFCEHAIMKTLFWCDFTWGSKKRSFEVFNSKTRLKICGKDCTWSVRTDGFYVKKGKQDVKMYDWQ
ncbi:S-protein homolog 5-like [Andrographis paniculata]|uniref:S-protein homolog 5-like n=1 Tax=Andrographis paniculata TaxID=175694 RepID=UPI0021E91C3F|nr:S-protein homolog 5-like [Andrographis paniculata]